MTLEIPELPPEATCGCCEEDVPQLQIFNRPGLPALSYRLSTYATFLRRMLGCLPREKIADGPNKDKRPLTALTTRSNDDPSIALLDGWATVADVLTFYQERIANEGYLRTATERLSVLELARQIGYELNPGVAASTFLVFTVEDAPGAPRQATVDIGTKVQSIPGQNQLPQAFETVEKIQARAEWNALRPQLSEPQHIVFGTRQLCLKGTSTQLQPGDAILVVGDERKGKPDSERWDFRILKVVTAHPNLQEPERSFTLVEWEEPLGHVNPRVTPAAVRIQVFAFRQRAALFGHNAPDWRTMPDSVKRAYLGLQSNDTSQITATEWPDFTVYGVSGPPELTTGRGPSGLYAEYFDNVDLTNRKVMRTDATVNFAWGNGSPAPAIGADTFSARWTGWVQPKKSGAYSFYTLSDDGVRLWVNNQLIINNWTDHAPTEESGVITLTAGEKYPIKLEYYERGGGATIKLSWSGPGQSKEIIPQSQLSHLARIHLDGVHKEIQYGSWLVLSSPEYRELYEVLDATEDARADFALSAKTTRLALEGENLDLFNEKLRETVVFGQSEELPLTDEPVTLPLHGDEIVLDQLIENLLRGQTLALSGKRIRVIVAEKATGLKLMSDDGTESVALKPGDSLQVMKPPSLVPGAGKPPIVLKPDELGDALSKTPVKQIMWRLMDRGGFVGTLAAASDEFILKPADEEDPLITEVVFIDDEEDAITSDRDRTTIRLREALQNSYDRATVTINANVARATHGETVKNEVLGGGDGSQPNQRFVLKRNPLTYVSAPTASGAKSTLDVRVDGVLWEQASSLFELEATDQNYIVQSGGDGKAQVIFGDGEKAARLPTGQENVVATYRSGIGLAGMVSADQLTLLQTRPLGIRGVTNPLPATGAAEPEVLEDARTNAPLTVLTLDRIVSLKDYEDFVRAFAGIAKAKAVAMWRGENQLVHITVAATNGGEVATSSTLYKNLVAAIEAKRDPGHRVEVVIYRLRTFGLDATVIIDSRYVTADVLAQIRSALGAAFSFQQRDFGQPVTAAEVIEVIQNVKGVVAVDLNKLFKIRPSTTVMPIVNLDQLPSDCTPDPSTPTEQPADILQAQVARHTGEITELLLLNPICANVKEKS